MANTWTGQKVDKNQINGGVEFISGVDVVGAEDVNAAINNSLYAVNIVDTVGVSLPNPDGVGTPSVTVQTDSTTGHKTIVFANLKGEKGDRGYTGRKGDTGLAGLMCAGIFGEQTGIVEPPRLGMKIEISTGTFGSHSFNRVPQDGDIFIALWETTKPNHATYLCNFECHFDMPEYDDAQKISGDIRVVSFVETTGATGSLPQFTSADAGKFLRVNASGQIVAETVPSAEALSL